MGLRALAYYLDRTEAVIVQSVLRDAGMLAIIGNEDMLRIQPQYTLAFGGYRVLVSDLDLEDAIAVIQGAAANPLRGGETLIVTGDLLDRVLGFWMGLLSGGVPTPLRKRRWAEAS